MPPRPSRDLSHLLAVMQPVLDPRELVFATLPHPILGLASIASFVEPEGLSVILERSEATRAGLPYIYPCRLITLSVHSALDAIGFVSAVTQALADAAISVNPVSAYHHDHLFVPADRAMDAMAVLAALSARAGPSAP